MKSLKHIFISLIFSFPLIVSADPALDKELVQSAMFGDAPKVTALIQKGADANARDNNRPAISWAAQNGGVEVVKALIAGKADVNAVDGIQQTPLMRAVDLGQLPIITLLLEAKANPNAKNKEGKTPLMMAISNGKPEVAKALIAGGADLNAQDNEGYTATLIAAQDMNAETLKVLVAAKADLNLGTEYYTPLSWVVEQGQVELVKILLEGGADPNAQAKSGGIPLARALDNAEVLQLMLDHKADPNLKNERGESVLMTAIYNGEVAKVESLIKAGANVNDHDASGNSVLVMAQNAMANDIVESLKKAGAKE